MKKDKHGQATQPMGRPSTYSEEITDRICNLMTGGMSLRKICMQDDFPDAATVYRWLDKYDEFRDKYARAREAATEDMLEEILEIADSTEIDPNDKRVRIDTRKWAMGKLKPKKYGERTTHELGNKDGEAFKVEASIDAQALVTTVAELMRAQKADQ